MLIKTNSHVQGQTNNWCKWCKRRSARHALNANELEPFIFLKNDIMGFKEKDKTCIEIHDPKVMNHYQGSLF